MPSEEATPPVTKMCFVCSTTGFKPTSFRAGAEYHSCQRRAVALPSSHDVARSRPCCGGGCRAAGSREEPPRPPSANRGRRRRPARAPRRPRRGRAAHRCRSRPPAPRRPSPPGRPGPAPPTRWAGRTRRRPRSQRRRVVLRPDEVHRRPERRGPLPTRTASSVGVPVADDDPAAQRRRVSVGRPPRRGCRGPSAARSGRWSAPAARRVGGSIPCSPQQLCGQRAPLGVRRSGSRRAGRAPAGTAPRPAARRGRRGARASATRSLLAPVTRSARRATTRCTRSSTPAVAAAPDQDGVVLADDHRGARARRRRATATRPAWCPWACTTSAPRTSRRSRRRPRSDPTHARRHRPATTAGRRAGRTARRCSASVTTMTSSPRARRSAVRSATWVPMPPVLRPSSIDDPHAALPLRRLRPRSRRALHGLAVGDHHHAEVGHQGHQPDERARCRGPTRASRGDRPRATVSPTAEADGDRDDGRAERAARRPARPPVPRRARTSRASTTADTVIPTRRADAEHAEGGARAPSPRGSGRAG